MSINLTIPGDAASYSSEVTRVIAAKPDVLIFAADPQTAATFLAEYKQLNSGSLPPMVTATDSLTPDFFNAVSKSVGVQYCWTTPTFAACSWAGLTPSLPPPNHPTKSAPHHRDFVGTPGTSGRVGVGGVMILLSIPFIGSEQSDDG